MDGAEIKTQVAVEENTVLREALNLLTVVIHDVLASLGENNEPAKQYCLPLDAPSGQVLEEVKEIADQLEQSLKKVHGPDVVAKLEEKLTMYEEKLVMYEEIMQKSEGSKDKQDCILTELQHLQQLRLTNLEQEKIKLKTWQEKLEEEKRELDQQFKDLQEEKVKHIAASLAVDTNEDDSPEILKLPRLAVERPPAWSLGPVTITPCPRTTPIITSGVFLASVYI